MKIYVFDIDGTICNNTYGKYKEARPYKNRINKINNLYELGHTIFFFTARGGTTGIDWKGVTEGQLKKWGVKYHKLVMRKLEGDIFIDDKGINANEFFKK